MRGARAEAPQRPPLGARKCLSGRNDFRRLHQGVDIYGRLLSRLMLAKLFIFISPDPIDGQRAHSMGSFEALHLPTAIKADRLHRAVCTQK